MKETPFISVIIPAHNEGKYIEETLQSLLAQDYPADRYEVIVVENGSDDDTRAKAEGFARGNIRVLSFLQKGVAFARNRGLEAARTDGDWILFLDADTRVAPRYFTELATFVSGLPTSAVVGSTSVEPGPSTAYARIWFFFFNFFHRILEQAYASIIVRRSALDELRFSEELSWMEDVDFVKRLRTRGTFFYMPTDSVSTSTRRYRKDGWWRHLFWNIYVGCLPPDLQKRFAYAAIR